MTSLIHLNGTINLANKPQTGEESNSTSYHKKRYGYHGHVREVEKSGDKSFDLELRHEVPHRVQEEIHTRRSGGEVRSPPPAVVLIAELEVAHNNGDLRTGDDEDEKNHEQEPEDEVQLQTMWI